MCLGFAMPLKPEFERENSAGHSEASITVWLGLQHTTPEGKMPINSGAIISGILLEVVTSAHALDAALSIHYSLLAGVEGVAVTAHLDSQDRFGTARLEYVAARAGYRRFYKLRVNFGPCNGTEPRRALWPQVYMGTQS